MEGNNPGFTVIEWDVGYMVPVNTYTYYMDMGESNKRPEEQPQWKLLHDSLATYSLKDLSPDSVSNLLDRLYNSEHLATLYEQNRFKQAEPQNHKGKLHNMKYKC